MRIIFEFDPEGKESVMLSTPNHREALYLAMFVRYECRTEQIWAVLGVNYAQLSHWRMGNRQLPDEAARRMADILDIPADCPNRPVDAPGWRRHAPAKTRQVKPRTAAYVALGKRP